MRFPWVDLLFISFVGFYAFRGYKRGLIRESLDLAGLAIGLLAAIKLYSIPGSVFRFFGLDKGWSNFVGGFLIFLTFLIAAAVLAQKIHASERIKGRFENSLKYGGAGLASLWAALFALFVMVVLTVIPTPLSAQAAVRDSVVGRTTLSGGSPVYGALQGFAKNDARNLLFYLRQYFVQIRPEAKQPVDKEFFKINPSNDIQVDQSAEKEVFRLVNSERTARGLKPLKLNDALVSVARAHSADMYHRGYFAHVDPDHKDPFQRMESAGMKYSYAGENLALAPTVTMVHTGLMNSPHHKENILKKEFTDLAIGIYKGPYGLMVTQSFCSACR